MTIVSLHKNLTNLGTDKLITEAVLQSADDLAQINRDRMLDGQDAKGRPMPDYSPVSVKVYGYPPGPIRLKATGAFQAAVKVEVRNDVVSTVSTDSKSEMLQKRYGNIFGTYGPYKKEFNSQFLGPRVREKISNLLQLKFK